MRYQYFCLLFVILFWMCKDNITNNYGTTPKLKIGTAIEDTTVIQGCSGIIINISKAFIVSGNPDADILKSLYAIQDPALVAGAIYGDSLNLSLTLTKFGTSEIIVRGEYEGEVEYCSFTITVSEISADDALNQAIAYFQAADYQSAASLFTIVIGKDNHSFHTDGYMGLGFCQMRQQQPYEAYRSFQTSLSLFSGNPHALAGLSLLEYAYTKNYTEAIRYGREILTSQPNYIFKCDDSLDFHDILLNIALSQYSLQLFEDCLATVKELEPAFALVPTDPEFQTKLFQKLADLVDSYS
jgi:tetratricopeptide (TPR) repeat protein